MKLEEFLRISGMALWAGLAILGLIALVALMGG